jgi:hypothetical protein
MHMKNMKLQSFLDEAVRQYRMACDLSDPTCLTLAIRSFIRETRQLGFGLTYRQARTLLTN